MKIIKESKVEIKVYHLLEHNVKLVYKTKYKGHTTFYACDVLYFIIIYVTGSFLTQISQIDS